MRLWSLAAGSLAWGSPVWYLRCLPEPTLDRRLGDGRLEWPCVFPHTALHIFDYHGLERKYQSVWATWTNS